MRMYLIKEGIDTVKTNYILCSKIINEIKQALKDYSYSIEIKTI